jgi:hypothetical protein
LFQLKPESNDVGPAPTPVPLSELAPIPSQEALFGKGYTVYVVFNMCVNVFFRNEAYNFFSSSRYEGEIGGTTSSMRKALG